MFLSNYNNIFLLMSVTSSILALNMNSLFFTWLFMEMNLLVVIPLLLMKSTFQKEQSSMMLKYFLIQVMGSLILLVFLIFYNSMSFKLYLINFLMVMILMMKSGVPPLHFWLPHIIQHTNYFQSFILLAPQKIIPLFLISYFTNSSLMFFIICSALLGGISGYNQNSLMKILAYSSMVHFSWMMSGIMVSTASSFFYFFIYSTIMLGFMKILFKLSLIYVSELIKNNLNQMDSIYFCAIVLTLSGTPPFLGFFNKLIVMKMLINTTFYFLSVMVLLGSMFSFYYYLRLMMLTSMFNFNKNKELTKKENNFQTNWLIFINVLIPLILWVL